MHKFRPEARRRAPASPAAGAVRVRPGGFFIVPKCLLSPAGWSRGGTLQPFSWRLVSGLKIAGLRMRTGGIPSCQTHTPVCACVCAFWVWLCPVSSLHCSVFLRAANASTNPMRSRISFLSDGQTSAAAARPYELQRALALRRRCSGRPRSPRESRIRSSAG